MVNVQAVDFNRGGQPSILLNSRVRGRERGTDIRDTPLPADKLDGIGPLGGKRPWVVRARRRVLSDDVVRAGDNRETMRDRNGSHGLMCEVESRKACGFGGKNVVSHGVGAAAA